MSPRIKSNLWLWLGTGGVKKGRYAYPVSNVAYILTWLLSVMMRGWFRRCSTSWSSGSRIKSGWAYRYSIAYLSTSSSQNKRGFRMRFVKNLVQRLSLMWNSTQSWLRMKWWIRYRSCPFKLPVIRKHAGSLLYIWDSGLVSTLSHPIPHPIAIAISSFLIRKVLTVRIGIFLLFP